MYGALRNCGTAQIEPDRRLDRGKQAESSRDSLSWLLMVGCLAREDQQNQCAASLGLVNLPTGLISFDGPEFTKPDALATFPWIL